MIVAVILIAAGLAIRVYYFEGMLFDYGDYYDRMSAGHWMTYASGFGDLAAILGLVFVIIALMKHQSGVDTPLRIPFARLASMKTLLIIAAIVMATSVIAVVSAWEFGWDLGGNIPTRLNIYGYDVAWLITSVALLLFVTGLRESKRTA